ncbi:MAG: putative tellurite resistance protein B-like protein [Alteromonas macleodii]|jgi:uncharacterized tellurite resistance protein B-like protein
MRAECEKLDAERPNKHELAHILSCEITSVERDGVMRALWQVVDSKGQLNDTNNQVISNAMQTFGMSHETATAVYVARIAEILCAQFRLGLLREGTYIINMFSDLFKRLTAPDPAPLPNADARVALGALMVRLARTDGSYDQDEIAHIDAVLAQRYVLTEANASALRAKCEIAETEAPDTVRFTRAIKNAVPYEDRVAVIEALWSVVLVDGVRDNHEDAMLRMIGPLLGVTDQDSHKARLRVTSG